MERVNAILRSDLYMELLRLTKEWEDSHPVFCRHGIEHMLDVARIAYILRLESGGNHELSEEIIYAAALLHDIGRARQYRDATPHERESARIAALLLPECGFDEAETALILDAISSHRMRGGGGEKTGLAELIYRADKLSRRCFDCTMTDECNWEHKNGRLCY